MRQKVCTVQVFSLKTTTVKKGFDANKISKVDTYALLCVQVIGKGTLMCGKCQKLQILLLWPLNVMKNEILLILINQTSCSLSP